MKRKSKGFTLIETIVALGILSLIAMLLLPSLLNLIKTSAKLKEQSPIIFALEEAIETEKSDPNPTYQQRDIYVNGYEITITRDAYNNSLDRIKASCKEYELEVLEVNNEKKGLYFN
ncbi:competence type IV pilus minor pilin ComGE [uncultured Anaerococcus sp.]|uniref:competence type IV pilus minor pilin ComGE n=1 Tax=uncultured Anaerococcus sp. TaxID=293428 RepID=UPI00261E5EEA|nr:competence type IV pilus minor pilin ComGE [uncultured Anaerococcus sp.]